MSDDIQTPASPTEAQPEGQPTETAEVPAAAPEPAPVAQEIAQQLRGIFESEAQKRQAEVQNAEAQRQRDQAARILELARTDPAGLVASVGGDVSRLQPKQTKPDVSKEIAELRAQLAQREQKEQAYVKQARMEQLRRGVRNFVDSREEFPLTKATGNADAVYDTMVAHHQAGNPISEEEAARQVESNLASFVEKAMALDSFKAKYGVRPNPQPDAEDAGSAFSSLSNLDGASTNTPSDRPATDEEITAALIAALQST